MYLVSLLLSLLRCIIAFTANNIVGWALAQQNKTEHLFRIFADAFRILHLLENKLCGHFELLSCLSI